MRNQLLRRAAVVAAIVTTSFLASAAFAQSKEAGVAAKKIRGRLPAHYSKIVTEEQREQIYKIQAEYKPKIDSLKKQLETLTKEQDEKIAAVLTPDQKKKLDEAIVESKEKRDAKKSEKQPQTGNGDAKKPADETNGSSESKPAAEK